MKTKSLVVAKEPRRCKMIEQVSSLKYLGVTCYEMERYLKDEPKMHQSLKKLNADMDTTWLKMEVDCLEDFGERHLDSLSTSSASSAYSWDSALSCAVLVKQEPVDDEEDDDDNYEEGVRVDTADPLQLRLVERNSTTLTPPSSPESGQGHSNGSSSAGELDVLRMGGVSRNTIVRVRASGLTRYISVVPRAAAPSPASPAAPTGAKHARIDHSPDSKRRIHKCQFLGCKKGSITTTKNNKWTNKEQDVSYQNRNTKNREWMEEKRWSIYMEITRKEPERTATKIMESAMRDGELDEN
ncbi:hypothetical protein FQA39_LY01889 [Lamprigera yunnana]|nr:hypothetical protein FQA39_LY01889 [Lamprigera yunnana]